MRKVLLGLGSLLFLSAAPTVQALEEGPADESAYWILKFPGKLNPSLVVSQTEVNFGETEVGRETLREIKILNKGYGDLVVKKVYLRDGTEFAIKEIGCTKPLQYGQSCEIKVVFKPVEPGTHEDSLYILTNDPTNPIVEVKLYGTALGAVVEVPQEVQPLVETPPVQPVEEKPAVVRPPKEEKKPVVKKPKKEEKLVPKYRIWEVKPCDTLWDISSAVYGTPLLWAAIFEANRDKITDPWIIEVGTKLRIPELTPEQVKKFKEETIRLMEEMADRPLGPKCP